MAQDSRSPEEIEREIEQERAALRDDIEQLVNKFTFDEAWNRVGRRINRDPGELGETVLRMVREKPFAVALTAIGLGWLMFGPRQDEGHPEDYRTLPAPDRRRRDWRKASRHLRQYEGRGGPSRFDTEVAQAGGGTSSDAAHSASGRGWTVSSDRDATRGMGAADATRGTGAADATRGTGAASTGAAAGMAAGAASSARSGTSSDTGRETGSGTGSASGAGTAASGSAGSGNGGARPGATGTGSTRGASGSPAPMPPASGGTATPAGSTAHPQPANQDRPGGAASGSTGARPAGTTPAGTGSGSGAGAGSSGTAPGSTATGPRTGSTGSGTDGKTDSARKP